MQRRGISEPIASAITHEIIMVFMALVGTHGRTYIS